MNSKIKVKYPIALRWKIDEFRLKVLSNSIMGIGSKTFGIPDTDVKYYATIYPNGNIQERRGETWISLYLDFKGKKEIEAQFYISIDSANFFKKLKYVYTKSNGWGKPICTIDELFNPEKQFIFDGEMVINVQGFLMIERDAPNKLCKLGCRGNDLCIDLWNQQNTDFTIVAEGNEIHAHKIILSTRSPVFEAMFKPHTKEAQEGKATIPDFSFDVVEAAIKFCYDSSLVENISFKNQLSLLQFFDKYDIRLLKNQLEEHLISEINETNVCLLANSSIISNSPKLRFKCYEFLLDCIRNVKAVTDLDVLDKDFAFELFKNSMSKFSR